MGDVNIDVDIDPYEVLDQMGVSEICDYVKEHDGCECNNRAINDLNSYEGLNELGHSFYHHDFDLKKFLIDFIGKDNVINLIEE